MAETPERGADTPERGAGFWAHRGLIAVATGTVLAEAGLLLAVAPAAQALAPQATALPPLAVFHDLRWLDRAPPSWPRFVLLLAGLRPGPRRWPHGGTHSVSRPSPACCCHRWPA